MKRIVYLIALLFATIGHGKEGKERSYFFYGEVQTMGLLPMVGVGYRLHEGHYGLDLSAATLPTNPPDSVLYGAWTFRTLYLFYPKQHGLYFGTGLGARCYEHHKIASSESAIGYQWANRIFLEGNAFIYGNGFNLFQPKGICPGLTFSVGF